MSSDFNFDICIILIKELVNKYANDGNSLKELFVNSELTLEIINLTMPDCWIEKIPKEYMFLDTFYSLCEKTYSEKKDDNRSKILLLAGNILRVYRLKYRCTNLKHLIPQLSSHL